MQHLRVTGKRLEPSTAVPESLYPETTAAKWHFPQENDTFRGLAEGTYILEPLFYLRMGSFYAPIKSGRQKFFNWREIWHR
jgi:hypothetical protein